MQLLQVTGGGGVEHVDFAAVRLQSVDVVDQLVQVLVPQVRVLVLEVGAHGHDDVIGLVHCGLKEDGDKEDRWLLKNTRKKNIKMDSSPPGNP